MPVRAMWLTHSELLSKAIPTFDASGNGPCSFWIRRVPAGR